MENQMLIPLRLEETTIRGIEQVFLKIAHKVMEDINQGVQVKPYMNKKESANYLGISFNTLIKLEKAGLPKLTVEGIQMFRKEDIDRFMEERVV